MQQCKV